MGGAELSEEAAEAAAPLPALQCGVPYYGRLRSGGSLGNLAYGDSMVQAVSYTSGADQLVTLTLTGSWHPYHGVGLAVFDAAERTLDQELRSRGTSVSLVFWADAGRTYRVEARAAAGYVWIGSEPRGGRRGGYESKYSTLGRNEGFGTGNYTLTVACGGGVSCAVDGITGGCQRSSTCSGRSVEGLCPGPNEVQCCVPAPEPLPPAPEESAVPGEPSAPEEPSEEPVAPAEEGDSFCPLDWLGGGDACDCGCGVTDPDCLDGGCVAPGCLAWDCDHCVSEEGESYECGVE